MNPIFEKRKIIIIGAMLLIALVYMTKLFSLQVIDKSYKEAATHNAIREIMITPPRGLIYDRNDSLLVYNEAAYDLMVVPKEVMPFDTLDLCRTIDMTIEEMREKLAKARVYSPQLPSVVKQQLQKDDYGYLQEKLHKFPGFFVQNRILRSYPVPIAAHILGYIGEITDEQLRGDSYYQLGDYIGISGIEKSYEEELRGVKGRRKVLVDVNNREQGAYHNGEDDVAPVAGKNLWSTIDLQLQEYGEKLLAGKHGSVVAIEPSTGEVLCVVSVPTYDPNLLVGKDRGKNYAALNADLDNTPLFNRALKACYPPGSTFKLANGLIAQQEGVINRYTYYSCGGGYSYGNRRVGCHSHAGSDLVDAVRCSCNAYFCRAFYNTVQHACYKTPQEGYQSWKNHINQLGFGQKFNTDLPYESKGIIPSVEYYDKCNNGHWNANTIISVAIGQGEVGSTPLQMANLMAIIANRGYYYKPHVVRAIGSKDNPNTRYSEKIDCGIDEKYFAPIIEGMKLAVTNGTGTQAQVPGVEIAGKTGTAQNPHGADHSAFACFAPVDNPKIAIFVLVENGTWGGVIAARVASLMIEFYLNREIKQTEKEEYIKNFHITYKKAHASH